MWIACATTYTVPTTSGHYHQANAVPFERKTSSFDNRESSLLTFALSLGLSSSLHRNVSSSKWGFEKQAVSRWFLLQRGNSCGDWDQRRHNCRLGHCFLQSPLFRQRATSTFCWPQHLLRSSTHPRRFPAPKLQQSEKSRFWTGSPLAAAQPSRELCFVASYCRHIHSRFSRSWGRPCKT